MKVLSDECNLSDIEARRDENTSTDKVTKRVNDWKLRLIDLTRRNRAIYFQSNKSSNLHITRPDAATIYEKLVVKGRSWEIFQPQPAKPGEPQPQARPLKATEIEVTYDDPAKLERNLRNLSRRSQTEYTERGVRVLFLASGTLTWNEKATGITVTSPLLLTPIELTRESSREPYTIRVPPVEDVQLRNPALVLKLKYEHGLELPPLPDDEEVSPTTYFETVQRQVEELGWKVTPTLNL